MHSNSTDSCKYQAKCVANLQRRACTPVNANANRARAYTARVRTPVNTMKIRCQLAKKNKDSYKYQRKWRSSVHSRTRTLVNTKQSSWPICKGKARTPVNTITNGARAYTASARTPLNTIKVRGSLGTKRTDSYTYQHKWRSCVRSKSTDSCKYQAKRVAN